MAANMKNSYEKSYDNNNNTETGHLLNASYLYYQSLLRMKNVSIYTGTHGKGGSRHISPELRIKVCTPRAKARCE